MKRILCFLISFIMIMGSPIQAFAEETPSVSQNEIQMEEVMEPESPKLEASEEVEGDSEVKREPSVSSNEVTEDSSVSTNEIVKELSVSQNEMPLFLSAASEYAEYVLAAKEAFAKTVNEKDIYGLVYLTNEYSMKKKPSQNADTVTTVGSAHTVQLLDVEVEWIYQEEWQEELPTVWYQVQFYVEDAIYIGYMEDEYLASSDECLARWKQEYSSLFPMSAVFTAMGHYTDIQQFPTSYHAALKKLKDAHPAWIFVPLYVGRNWNDCVNEQMGNYSWIQKYNSVPDSHLASRAPQSGWYYASKEGISYYMDPRNFLNEPRIFMFEQNTYNASYHTVSVLQTFLASSFMAGKVPNVANQTYAELLISIGNRLNLSPFLLASRIIQEQGWNGSMMVSGAVSGFEGYYNHFNVKASGSSDEEVIKNGLTHAKNKGWNSVENSIVGGASLISKEYIGQGQDTLYLQKFDVLHGSSALHQYMQNIRAPYSESSSVYNMYNGASGTINSAFVFKIPIFNNMPGVNYTIDKTKLTLERNKTYTLQVKCNGSVIPPESADYSSDNSGIVSVSADGVITAVGSGTANISVEVGDGDDEVTLNCVVTVYSPLEGISLQTEEGVEASVNRVVQLYHAASMPDGELPDWVPYLDGNGVTQMVPKVECKTNTTLQVVYEPGDTTDSRAATWSVADDTIISIESSVAPTEENAADYVATAKITALKAGTTTVTVKVGKHTETCTVTVRIPMVKAALDKNEVALYTGERVRIGTTYLPFETNDQIEPVWRSEDESVVSVNYDGTITAKKAGTTRVHAAIGPFDGTQESLTVNVTVSDYIVTFLNENGSPIVTATGHGGEKLSGLISTTEDEIPWLLEKEGAHFVGWYTEENGKGQLVTRESVLYENMMLYPCFVEEAVSEFYIQPLGSYTYTGSNITPAVQVFSGDELLVKGIDYKVSYSNNKKVSTDEEKKPTVEVTGIGEYADDKYRLTATFEIVKKNLTESDVVISDMETEYTGRLKKLQPTVYVGKRVLRKNIDYSLTYPDEGKDGAYREAGVYAVMVTGIGNYIGKKIVYITISKRIPIEDAKIESIEKAIYNNGAPFTSEDAVAECKPAISLTYGKEKLVENVDYTLAYSNNKEIGTGTITIYGKGDYVGFREVSFDITGTKLSTVKLSVFENPVYTGEMVTVDFELKDAFGKVLQLGADYEVSYKNNLEAGYGQATITGIHGYTGSMTKYFKIEPYDISDEKCIVSLASTEVEFDKMGAVPEVVVTYNGNALISGTDYKISYRNQYQVNIASVEPLPTVIITGMNNFTGTVEKNYSITSKNIFKTTVTVKDVGFKNREGFCFAEPVITDVSGRVLAKGKDYEDTLIYTYATDVVLTDGTIRLAGDTVEPTDIPTVGELSDAMITVTARGCGNYIGEVSGTYRIVEGKSWIDIFFGKEEKSAPELKLNRTMVYLDPLYPDVTDEVKIGLEEGTLITDDFTVEFVNDAEGTLSSLFEMNIEDSKLNVRLKGTREELSEEALPDGNYGFHLTMKATIGKETITLPSRYISIKVMREMPVVTCSHTGAIDLVKRDSTFGTVILGFVSEKDGLKLPRNAEECAVYYKLAGNDANNFEIDFENSVFESDGVASICIKAKEKSTYVGEMDMGSEQLDVGVTPDLILQYTSSKGVPFEEEIMVRLTQSDFKVSANTNMCYIKTEDGIGEMIFDVTQGLSYSVTTSNEDIAVTTSGRRLQFTVAEPTAYESGSKIELTVFFMPKGAGKSTKSKTLTISLYFCDKTLLEKLLAMGDLGDQSLSDRQDLMSSYQATRLINSIDQKIIAANTVDFSNVKIAFLGDDITAGKGLDSDEDSYCDVVDNSLNPEDSVSFGYKGAGILQNGKNVSLYDHYSEIPLDTDYIIVQAGMNDALNGNLDDFGSIDNLADAGTFCGDTYSLMSALQSEYTHSKIIFLTPLPISVERISDSNPSLSEYASAIKTIAKKEALSNVFVWDLYNSNLLDQNDVNVYKKYMDKSNDLNEKGHKILGQRIASELIRMEGDYASSGEFDPYEPEGVYFTPADYKSSTHADDTYSFNQAIKYAHYSEESHVVYVPAGIYTIDTEVCIQPRDDVDIIMHPNAYIKASIGRDKGYRVFELDEVDNVSITGGQIIGDREYHVVSDPENPGEWGMGIAMYDCDEINISDVIISNCWGDGIYIGSNDEDIPGAGCHDVYIDNCIMTNNRRNNMSIVCADGVVVDRSSFDEANGTDPQYGLCIEPNEPEINPCKNILISNSSFTGNKNAAVGIITLSDGITFSGCYIDGDFINFNGLNVTFTHTTVTGEMNARYGIIKGEGNDFNLGSSKQDQLVAVFDPSRRKYTFAESGINIANKMECEIISDTESEFGKALRMKRLSAGNIESGYFLHMKEFNLINSPTSTLESGVTYRIEYDIKGDHMWGTRTNQTGWYWVLPTEEYRTAMSTHTARSASTCDILFYAMDNIKEMQLDISSVRIYKVQ